MSLEILDGNKIVCTSLLRELAQMQTRASAWSIPCRPLSVFLVRCEARLAC